MATTEKTATVVGVFNSVQDAHEAIRHLENQGFSKDEVSLVCNKNATGYDRLTDEDKSAISDKASDVLADAGIGAAIGGVGGLLLSIAGLAIPGIGPVLAAGPIAAALTGAGIGAAGGGLIGALTESGVPEEHAHYYSESIRRGDVMVTVRADGERADRAKDVMDEHGAIDVDERVENWRSRGWEGRYDESAEPLSRDDYDRERSFYGSTMAGATGQMDDSSHVARTGDYEGTTKSSGTWSRDTKRGAAIGLGLDPMGRPMDSGSDLADDARRTARQAGDRAEQTGDRVEEGARSGMHRAGEQSEKLGHRMEEGMEKAGHRVEEAWDKMTGDSGRHAETAKHRAEEAAHRAGHRAEELGDKASNRVDEVTERMHNRADDQEHWRSRIYRP